MSSDLNKLEQEVAEHRGRVNEFIANTIGYRKDLCAKLDRITSVLTKLPCDARQGWYTSIGRQVGFMWVVLGVILAAIVGVGVKGMFDNTASVRSLSLLKEGMVAETAQCVRQELLNERNDKK